jgi:hemerythrin superfamily protein
MNISEILKKDHQKFEGLLDQPLKTSRSEKSDQNDQSKETFEALRDEAVATFLDEESVFQNAFRKDLQDHIEQEEDRVFAETQEIFNDKKARKITEAF